MKASCSVVNQTFVVFLFGTPGIKLSTESDHLLEQYLYQSIALIGFSFQISPDSILTDINGILSLEASK